MTFFARSSEWTRAHKDAADATPFAGGSQHYFAFLSYSHQDQTLADWLEDQLEKFRVPRHLVGRITDYGAVPRKLTPIFRDLKELPASDDLGTEIKSALIASRFLIVLCSPGAARSRWANAEIEVFKRAHPEGGVFAAILSGEPFASDMPGREEEECLPHALRFKYDRRGRLTAKRAEPLAADLREPGEARRLGLLKLVAGMLGVGLDDLVRREEIRRQRRLAALTAASIAGMVITSGLAVTAITARDEARDQRREAESLVGFMLGDLKGKLEPIGRLDALDGVGARVLEYYHKQDTGDLSDAALLQRSRALSLTAEVANLRGDLDTAQRLYREAAAGTGEALRRNGNDPQRLFDHAQNIYYVGDLAAQRGEFDRAADSYREYKRLADRMVAVEPNNLKWRMEVQYAESNLGILLMKQRRFDDAARQLSGALRTIEAVVAVDPTNEEYQKSLAASLGWLSDAELWRGELDEAIIHRRRLVALLERQSHENNGDVEYRQKLIPAHRSLGKILAARGLDSEAERHLRAAVSIADELIPQEPENMRWLDYGVIARLTLAQYLLGSGKAAEAERETANGCALARRLVARDRSIVDWQVDQLTCLNLRAQLAVRERAWQEALILAKQAVASAAKLKSGDRLTDLYALAHARRVLGDVYRQIGDNAAARSAWREGLSVIPVNVPERPWELAERGVLLSRLGNLQAGRDAISKLAAMGFRTTEVLRV